MRRERRRHGRFPVTGIFGTLRSPGDIRLLDLSRTGIAFETAGLITVGQSYFLELRYGDATVSVEAIVKWCAQRGSASDADGRQQPLFQVGASFVDIHRDAPGGLWATLEIAG